MKRKPSTTRPFHPDSRYSNRHGGGRFLSLKGLFLLLALALGLAGYLIPKQAELVKRLMADGRHDRALALVGEEMAKSADPETGEPIPTEATPANLVKLLLDSIDHDFDESSRVRIDTLVQITEDPAGVRDELLSRRKVIPGPLMAQLLDHLATRAVQNSQPELAVSIYQDLKKIAPLNLDQTRACVAANRYAGNPRGALDTVSAYLEEQQMPFTQLPEDLRDLIVGLHRELNEGSIAFDLLSEEFKATLDAHERESLIGLITTVAAQSSRLPDSLPILEEFLANTEAGEKDWRQLATQKTPGTDDADYLKFASMLAQHLEWNNQTSEAFDYYRKLAVMGDVEALDRCVTIYPWVDRQEDVTDLLQTVVPVVQRERYTLLLARLLAERGDFPNAESIYREELAGKHAEDASIWAELGDTLDAQERFDEALTAYRTALELDSERHDIRIRLARLHVTLGNYPAALLAYRKLPADAHDRKTREDYAMIAKSLDESRDFIHAIQLKIKSDPNVEAGDFLDMADAWESLAEIDSVEKTLQSGLQLMPESATLKLQLADFLAKNGRRDEAFDELARSHQVGDKRFAARLLSLGYETGRFEETIRLVTTTDQHWSPTERFDLASLYEETGNVDAALAQYRQAEGGESDVARIEAEIAFMRGDVNGALARQKRFLDLLSEPDYEAWTFYGDLFRAAGRTDEAEAAYRTALEHLKQQIAAKPVERPAVATLP
ncbi:MAG: tetratricopeptide repeat protein [Verrucomicrobiae bacterium]|nr:tetratricopeptide repeat protein [Verrucomicrobiae bacterium]